MPAPELIAVAISAGVGSALAVLGVVRHELRGVRDDLRHAHRRIDALEAAR